MASTSPLKKTEPSYQQTPHIDEGDEEPKSSTQLHLIKKTSAGEICNSSENKVTEKNRVVEKGVVEKRATKDIKYTEKKNRFIGKLYAEHWPKLLRSLKAMVRSEDVAEDIAHDAFLRVSQLEKPEELEYPYAYLYRTATNLIKDRAKAQRIREDYKQLALLDDDCHVETISPEHQLLALEKLTIANRAINALPPKCRRVFLLHRLDNLSHKEIAQQVGISKYAVEKHVMRAMARCRDSI